MTTRHSHQPVLPCALLAVGLLLCLDTQLRFGSLPIGPGEGALALSIAWLLGEVLRNGRAAVGADFWALLLFWLAFIVAQCVGMIAGGLAGDLRDNGLMLHDAMTYPLLIAVSCLTVVGPQAQSRIRTVTWGVAIIGTILTVMQLLDAFTPLGLPQVDPWYWDRLRGWTANPNQWALSALLVSGFAFHLAETAGGALARALALLCAGLVLVAGTLAQTNAYSLGIGAGVLLYVLLKGAGWLVVRRPVLSIRAAAAWVAVLTWPVLLLGAVVFASSGQDSASLLGRLARDKGQGTSQEAQVRLELWDKAIDRLLDSHLLGWGPGPHLPIPSILLDARWGTPFEPINVQHPTPGAAPNFEAHNSLLEMSLQGGALALGSFVALMGTCIVRCFRAGNLALLCVTCSVLLFGSFHVITRHPAVWFLIGSGMASTPKRPRPACARAVLRPALGFSGG